MEAFPQEYHHPAVPPPDPLPDGVPALPRLERLRAALLAAPYEICTQKAEIMTRSLAAGRKSSRHARAWRCLHARAYLRAIERQTRGRPPSRVEAAAGRVLLRLGRFFDRSSPGEVMRDLSVAFSAMLDQMELHVYPDELIVGNGSSRRIGAPLHPDYAGLLLVGELDSLPQRPDNPLRVDPAQAKALREEILPAWFDRSVLALTALEPEGPALTRSLLEGNAFVLTQFAGISHLTPDYPRVLRLGFAGLEERIHSARAALAGQPEDDGRLAFYDAAITVVRAARRHARRWRNYLTTEAEAAECPGRRAELLEMAAVLGRVPEHPARTFREALQSLFLTHAMVHQESFQHGVSFGRLDQYLLPYYRADLAAGRLAREQAVELLGCFLGKAAELLPLFFSRATEYFSGLSSASGITLAGTRADGGDAVNDLSYLILHAYDRMRLRQPNLHVRVHPATAPEFIEFCGRILARGGGMPAFFNDESVVAALQRNGYTSADARAYSIVGCAEWGVPGRSFPAAGAGFVSLPFALHLALHEGRLNGRRQGPRTPAVVDLTDTEALLAAFRTQLRALLARATGGNNAIERVHARRRPTPFLSLLVDGPVQSGLDLTAGGAVYNPSGFQAVGLADVVDSLTAIETLVFGERRVSLDALVAAVDANFAGQDVLHARILNRTPHYGAGDEEAAALAAVVSRMYVDELARYRNPRGGSYHAGFWTMTTHQGLGRRLGALPSGRLAGEPFANGASAVCGSQCQGPTAALAAAARVSTPGNGCVVNQTLSTGNLAGADSGRVLAGLIRGFFRQGGSQIQINVVDPEILADAQRNPAAHRDLVVRVSGYSAYFVDLTQDMQNEIIARAREAAAS